MNRELHDLGETVARATVTPYLATLQLTSPADFNEPEGFSPAQTVYIALDGVWKLRDLLNKMHEVHLSTKSKSIT